MIGAVIYTIIDDCIYFDYLVLLQETLSKNYNNFESTRFYNFYGLGIPDILMNIMSCHGCYKSTI